MSSIVVVGLGYIGLPTALVLASHGNNVIGVDTNPNIISSLRDGNLTFEENGIQELFSTAREEGIQFSDSCVRSEYYIIAVPTPYDKHTKKINPLYILKAIEEILTVCEPGAVLIIESTVSPGTIDKLVREFISQKGLEVGKDLHLAHAPERIIPGNMIHELVYNSRTIGADDCTIAERVRDIYCTFCKGEIVLTDIRTAEMTKVVENTFRDINIAFANELAKICRLGNMDVYEIIRIANKHPRVNILAPGPGVGGHCISVDPWFLVGDYPGLANLILSARKINDSMPEYVLGRVSEIMEENNLSDLSRVGFYGLAYKENVDDTRESPTLQLLEKMKRHLAPAPKVYDPFVKKTIVPNQLHSFSQFLNEVDLVVIMVAHEEILRLSSLLDGKLVLDTKNVCSGPRVFRL